MRRIALYFGLFLVLSACQHSSLRSTLQAEGQTTVRDVLNGRSGGPIEISGKIFTAQGTVFLIDDKLKFDYDQTYPAPDQCVNLIGSELIEFELEKASGKIVTLKGELHVKRIYDNELVTVFIVNQKKISPHCWNTDNEFLILDVLEIELR